jgi:hypothetical protein
MNFCFVYFIVDPGDLVTMSSVIDAVLTHAFGIGIGDPTTAVAQDSVQSHC